MFAGQERWFHKRFLSVGSDGSWERMIVMFSLAHRTVLIANNIRLMSKEMEPKVSINDLKKIRSFSRQRNMVCSRHSKRERERGTQPFFRMSSRRSPVRSLRRSTDTNTSNEPFSACCSVERKRSFPTELAFVGQFRLPVEEAQLRRPVSFCLVTSTFF